VTLRLFVSYFSSASFYQGGVKAVTTATISM